MCFGAGLACAHTMTHVEVRRQFRKSALFLCLWVLGIKLRSSDLVTSTDPFCQFLLCLCQVCILEVCERLLRSAPKETLENVHSGLCGNLSTRVSRQFWALRWSSLHTCSWSLHACCGSSTQFLHRRFLSRLDFGRAWIPSRHMENDVG